MKVALSASGKSINDFVDPRFGRCPFFVVIDTDDMETVVYANESSRLQGSAGIQAARFLADNGVGAVVTGHCGPNASLSLQGAGIKLFEGQGGISINQAFKKLVNGDLTATGDATALFHNSYCENGEGRSFGHNPFRGCDVLKETGHPIPQTKEPFQRQRPWRKEIRNNKMTERR